MRYEYSKTMRNLMKKKPGNLVHFTFIFVILTLILCLIYGFIQDEKQTKQIKENAQNFDSFKENVKYSKLTPQYLSEAIASNVIESIYYYIAVDRDQYAYLVAINAKDAEKYQQLILYTYQDNVERPSDITFQGVPVKIDDSLKGFAIGAFNNFAGENLVDDNNFNDMLGIYYLDTTQDIPTDDTFIVCILSLILLLIPAYILLRLLTKRALLCRKATLNRYDEIKLGEVDLELQDDSTSYYKKQKVYFTKNYIVSKERGFDIVPYEEIVHVYGLVYGSLLERKKYAIVAETNDHVMHEIAIIIYKFNWEIPFDEIVDKLQSILPDITYGFEDGFITAAKPYFNINVDTAASQNTVKSNMLLGIVGALLGAALGAVLWIFVGMAGIIAGIAGYVIMVMAILGYRKLSGFLDKKGQLIALFIAFFMIFFANYLSFVITYYLGTNLDFLQVFTHLPEYLSKMDAWNSFFRDMIVGYLLSIWAGFRILKSIIASFKTNKINQ